MGETNRVKFIRADAGDTYESLTLALGKLNWELPRYNDAGKTDSIFPGQIIYIQPKRNRAQAGNRAYTLKPGETMKEISQQFAIKLAKLYEMNQISPGTQPPPGTKLHLRKAVRTRVVAPESSREKISGGEEKDEIRVDIDLN